MLAMLKVFFFLGGGGAGEGGGVCCVQWVLEGIVCVLGVVGGRALYAGDVLEFMRHVLVMVVVVVVDGIPYVL
jgi:hypothetical protein